MKTAVRDMCWRLSQHHGLRPINTTENNALCDALTQYYRSETENTLARLERELKEWREGVRTLVHATDLITNKSLLNPKEQDTMSDKPAFETKHFVNGVEASTLTDENLIHAIRKIELEMEALGKIVTKSTKIEAKILELDAQRTAIAALLDSRP